MKSNNDLAMIKTSLIDTFEEVKEAVRKNRRAFPGGPDARAPGDRFLP